MSTERPSSPNGDFAARLEPRVKNISQSTIRKKWKPLPASSQERVRQIILNLKAKRSGAGGSGRIPPARKPGRPNKTTSKAREEEYENMVEEVTEKLLSRLPRMPFPRTSSTHPDDSPFDLSATLSRITNLQSQLTTNTQSSNLLRRQIRNEMRALKRDRAELKRLETGLRSCETLRRKKERGLHPVARELDEDDSLACNHAEEIERVTAAAGIRSTKAHFPAASLVSNAATTTTMTPPCLATTSDQDPELNPLLLQLRSHLVSMQNNTSSMLQVVGAMEETKTKLELFTASRFDEDALRRMYAFDQD